MVRGGASRSLSNAYIGVNGVARQVNKIYIGVNGYSRLVWQRGTPIGDLAIGSTVKIAINGTNYDFIVVHQGNPDSSIYDSSCNGTWLLMKNIYTNMVFNSSGNSYKSSTIDTYLNNTFYNLIDSNVRTIIKQVKIPYQSGTSSSSVVTGANGLSTRAFLLSGTEVGLSSGSMNTLGAKLSYFISGTSTDANNKRIAYYNDSATGWWTRSPYGTGPSTTWFVEYIGVSNYKSYSGTSGIRPCIILPQDTLIDDEGNIVT